MKNKLEKIFQISFVCLIIKIFYYDSESLFDISKIIDAELFYLFIYIVGVNLLLTFLFHLIISLITNNKIKFNKTLEIFLQGGIINQIIPTAGHVYRYYKLKKVGSVNLAEYTISQAIFSIYSATAYLLLGILLGLFFIAEISFNKTIYLIIFSLISVLAYIVFKKKLSYYAKSYLKKIKRLSHLIDDISSIKITIKQNLSYFIYIFCGFIILCLSESYAFFFFF